MRIALVHLRAVLLIVALQVALALAGSQISKLEKACLRIRKYNRVIEIDQMGVIN